MGVVFIMPSLSYTLRAKVITKMVKKARSMINRYGFSSKRMKRNIVGFVNLFRNYEKRRLTLYVRKDSIINACFIKIETNDREKTGVRYVRD